MIIIASGESMLDIAYELKMRGARNIFTCCTFPLFTAGLEKFDKAYNDGIINGCAGHEPDLPQAGAAGARVVL